MRHPGWKFTEYEAEKINAFFKRLYQKFLDTLVEALSNEFDENREVDSYYLIGAQNAALHFLCRTTELSHLDINIVMEDLKDLFHERNGPVDQIPKECEYGAN